MCTIFGISWQEFSYIGTEYIWHYCFLSNKMDMYGYVEEETIAIQLFVAIQFFVPFLEPLL